MSVRHVKQTNKGLNQHKNKKHSVKHVANLQTHSVYIKLWATLHCLTTLKIGKLPLTANSPNLGDLTISRVPVNG